MAIDSKNLLVWVKAMSRGQALPLDASEIYATLAEAENYAATSAIAYAGQTVKAKTEDGKYHSYTLQPSEAGYVLEEIGAIKESDLKQYVQVVDALPESGQTQGVLYIKKTTTTTGEGDDAVSVDSYTDGYIWTGSAWKQVFWDVTADVTAVAGRVSTIEGELPKKAPLANPVFSGTVKVGEDEVALKSYVEGLFANLVSSAPGIVDSTHALPATGYKAGQTFRVAEGGTYAGTDCETGDLIIVVKDYAEGAASNGDFMVVQANIDGAVTSSADASTIGEIVVFDAVTGKVIKGSGVQIASLNDAIAKAHEHANATQLATYDKTQAELLETARSEAQGLVNGLSSTVDGKLANKADKATTIAGYGITDAYTTTQIDGKLKTITDNLNTKVTGTDVDTKIEEATPGILEQAAEATSEAIANKADKATTLAGYGITDAYTTTQVDGKMDTKAAKALYINLTKTGDETYTADKTGKEVIDAYNAGAELYACVGVVRMPMHAAQDIKDEETYGDCEMFHFEFGLFDRNGVTHAAIVVAQYGYNKSLEQDVNVAAVIEYYTENTISDLVYAIGTGDGRAINTAVETAIEAQETRIGDIPADTTIKSYIDTAVGSGGTASAQAIATAKQEAITESKGYTDTQITNALTVVEF